MICGCCRLTSCTSVRSRPHLRKQPSAAYSPVELVETSSCLPFRLWGFFRIASASLARAITTLAADSSLVIPIVRMLNRAAPSTAGADPVPPTSHDLEGAAATCGAPAGNVLKLGAKSICCHQPFSDAMKYGSDQ